MPVSVRYFVSDVGLDSEPEKLRVERDGGICIRRRGWSRGSRARGKAIKLLSPPGKRV